MKVLDARKKSDADVILDSLNDGVVTIGLDKKIKYLNRAAEELLGYTLEEANGMPCATVVHCTACENDCLLERTLSTGRHVSHYETVLQNKKGRIISASFNTALLKDKKGRIFGGVEIIRDQSQIEALSEQLRGKYSFENFIGKNYRMQEIYALLPKVAKTQSAVLIRGERGTGKELIAHSIHQNSTRRDKPFIKLDCETIAGETLESELFGHVKGAFAGALSDKIGCFELADGGTLFLNEIGHLNRSLQAKLLQVLKNEEFNRIGGTRKVRPDVRILAATCLDLDTAVQRGEFLGELYDRLRTASIELPPLRERRDDIPMLIRHFLKQFNLEMEKKIESVAPEAMDVLVNYDYPGNIQEMENLMEHAVVLCRGKTILPSHLPKNVLEVKENFMEYAAHRKDPLRVMERQLLLKILSEAGWNYKEAASRLKVSRTTLWRKIKNFGIDRPKSK
jgi:PAS domain S-box-containing protein